jgi:ribosomal protein L37E
MATQPRIPLQRTASDVAPRSRRGRSRGQMPAGPLGSLTQRDHRIAVECRDCGSPHVTRLSMSLTDGTPVDFTSCHRCEHRTWEHAGDELSVAGVLDRTRKL